MANVNDWTALATGWRWTGQTYDGLSRGGPAFVTFSFPTAMQPHAREAYSAGAAGTWGAFNAREKDLARDALKAWADASGLVFLEVGSGRGDIQFNWIDFDKVPGYSDASGFASYPAHYLSETGEFLYPDSGDIYAHKDERGTSLADDGNLMHLLLQEIGHAVGLKHPHETDWTNSRTLSSSVDNTTKTVMSYEGDWTDTLGPLDLGAVRALYGGSTSDGSHLS